MRKILLSVLLLCACLYGRDYSYTEHFPVLPQPWYFAPTMAVDVGPGGTLYILHSNNKVSVFSGDGVFLRQYSFYYQSWNGPVRRMLVAIAVDPSGNIYLGDSLEGVLFKADPQGNIVNKFYHFLWEGDLECDSQGNVYLADPHINDDDPLGRSNNVIKFDPQGNILLQFGAPAYNPPEAALLFPVGLGLDAQGNIYVADGRDKIKKYDPQANFLGSFGVRGSGPGQIDYPREVELDASGNLYVLDGTSNRIQKFASTFSYITQWQTDSSTIEGISEIEILNSKIYSFGQGMQAFDLNGNPLFIWQAMGHDPREFWNPKRVWVDNPGNVYVCDTGNNRVQKFDRKWNSDIIIGSEGTGAGQFKNPSGVYVDDEGSIYVADKDNYRVQKFDKKGQFLLQWGSKGVDNGQFEKLLDVDGDKDGFIYTLDGSNTYVQKFTRQGQFVLRFKAKPHPDARSVQGFGVGNTGLIYIAEYDFKLYIYDTQGNFVGYIADAQKISYPSDVAVSPAGDIFVSDYSKGVVQFNPDGTFVAYLAGGSNVLQDAYSPTGVAVHNTGRLYICEEANGRVLVYEPKAGLKMTVPAAASIHGALGTDWRTDLSIFNPGSSAIDVTLDYYKADGALSSSFTLQPSTFLSLPDVIGTTFSAPNTFGALTAVCEPVAKWVSKGNRMPIGINQQGGLAYYHLNPTEEGPHGQSFP